MNVKYKINAALLRVVCWDLLGSVTPGLPVEWWFQTYPLDVILYALLETKGKMERTSKMTDKQTANFASAVMERKYRDEIITL